jgi:hypothetical protein
MKRRILAFGSLAVGLASMVLAVVTLLPSDEAQAADHLDGSLASGNVLVDINDIYAFRPTGTDDLCVVMSCHRFTGQPAGVRFDNNGVYELYVDNTGDTTPEATVSITFSGTAPQQYTVNGLGAPITGDVSGYGSTIIGGGGGIQIYAGPRDDPFFFDLVGFQQFTTQLYLPDNGLRQNGLNDPPVNFFAGGNVAAIAIQLPIVAVNGVPGNPNMGTIRAWGKTFINN